MSVFKESRVQKFYEYSKYIVENKERGRELFETYRDVLMKITPKDVIFAFHKLLEDGYDMESIKTAVNKILHTVYTPLKNIKLPEFEKDGVIDLFIRDNLLMEKKLEKIKPLIMEINKNPESSVIKKIYDKFEELLPFENHYIAKENIIFPIFEKKERFFKCTHIMWSFDDDIRKNLKKLLNLLKENFNLREFNIICGRLYFDMYSISFRENHILFPYLLEIADEDEINSHLTELQEIGLPFVKFSVGNMINLKAKSENYGYIDLNTGNLTPDEIRLIFNNLPVDITFVDEKDEVKFFSSPRKRIFPRTKAILGRKVQNCHPPESIDVVNKIISSFKSGERDRADFWINFKDMFIYIEYIAVRDDNGNYRGVLEVTQDISDKKVLKGEKRLLDWE